MTPAIRLAAAERALELLGRDLNAERELVGHDLEQLESRLFELLRAQGASPEVVDAARARWPVDPEGVLLDLFGENTREIKFCNLQPVQYREPDSASSPKKSGDKP